MTVEYPAPDPWCKGSCKYAALTKRIAELEAEARCLRARIEYLEASLKEAGLPIYHER